MSETTVARSTSKHRRWMAYDVVVATLLPLGMLAMFASLL